jgi:hypothetical protein
MSVAFGHLTTRIRSVNASNEPAIHWPSAVVGLVLAVLVVVSVSWLASPRPSQLRAPQAPAAAPAKSVPAVAPTPIPAPPPPPPPAQPASQRLRVAGTNGRGANLRAKPGEQAQRIKTMPEGTLLDTIGGPETVDGLVWRNVRDAAGATGWIAAPFAAPVS